MKKFIWIMLATAVSACTAFYTTPLAGMGFSFGVFVGGAGLAVMEWIDDHFIIS